MADSIIDDSKVLAILQGQLEVISGAGTECHVVHFGEELPDEHASKVIVRPKRLTVTPERRRSRGDEAWAEIEFEVLVVMPESQASNLSVTDICGRVRAVLEEPAALTANGHTVTMHQCNRAFQAIIEDMERLTTCTLTFFGEVLRGTASTDIADHTA